jgi:hypothetical protein
MPPAKKPATRRAPTTPAEMSAATRRRVEQAAKRLEKSIDETQSALAALGQDLGSGGRTQYKHLEKAAKSMRRDAEKTNKQLRKDLEALAAAVTKPGAAKTSTTRKRSPARKTTASRTASTRRKTTASRKPAASGSRSARRTS